MTNKQPERSIEDIVEEYKAMCVNDDTCRSGYSLTIDMELLSEKLTQTLQAERQRCEEMVEEALVEYKQFVLNVLDGIDIADGGCNTKAIRLALQSRTITQPNKPK